MLFAVDVLFAVFAVVQVVYLFGGADTLAAIGMTYSDYARQGYFQLVAVVALAGLLLIGAHESPGGAGPPRGAAHAPRAHGRDPRARPRFASGSTRTPTAGPSSGSSSRPRSLGWRRRVVIAIALLAANRMRWIAHGLAVSAVAITLAVSVVGPQRS